MSAHACNEYCTNLHLHVAQKCLGIDAPKLRNYLEYLIKLIDET